MSDIELLKSISENSLLLRAILHDLANPLSVILSAISCVELSGTAGLNENLFFDKIRNAAIEQKELLERVNKLKRILLSDQYPILNVIDLDDVLRAGLAKINNQIRAKEIKVEVIIEEEQDSYLLAENEAFSSLVLDCLLSNAIRFSPNKSEIQIISKRKKNRIFLEFSDNGPGISAAILRNVFHIKSRVKTIDTDGRSGLGMGLSLLKYYLDKVGGEIAISSCFGERNPSYSGTVVTLSFIAPS